VIKTDVYIAFWQACFCCSCAVKNVSLLMMRSYRADEYTASLSV